MSERKTVAELSPFDCSKCNLLAYNMGLLENQLAASEQEVKRLNNEQVRDAIGHRMFREEAKKESHQLADAQAEVERLKLNAAKDDKQPTQELSPEMITTINKAITFWRVGRDYGMLDAKEIEILEELESVLAPVLKGTDDGMS